MTKDLQNVGVLCNSKSSFKCRVRYRVTHLCAKLSGCAVDTDNEIAPLLLVAGPFSRLASTTVSRLCPTSRRSLFGCHALGSTVMCRSKSGGSWFSDSRLGMTAGGRCGMTMRERIGPFTILNWICSRVDLRGCVQGRRMKSDHLCARYFAFIYWSLIRPTRLIKDSLSPRVGLNRLPMID